MKLKLGFSTCPNDTFIFDAMVNKRIDTEDLEFDLVLADVEELNKMSMNSELDVTKISYHSYVYVAHKYKILDSGSALGRNNGPLLISKKKIYPDEVPDLKIAIPGLHTTAYLLLRTAYPQLKEVKEYLFSDITEAILSNEVDAGLIIHETRFTYERLGLQKIIDFGEFWETKMNMPVPLGGIIINRNLSDEIQQKFSRILRKSVEYAFENPNASLEFVRQYAQEIEEDVMYKHIKLYVNEFTKSLGKTGRDSILTILNKAVELGFVTKLPKDIFVD